LFYQADATLRTIVRRYHVTNQKTTGSPELEGNDAQVIAARCVKLLAEEDRTWSDRADDLLRNLLPRDDGELKRLVTQAEDTGGADMVEELLYRLERVSTERKFVYDGRPKRAKLEVVPITIFPGQTSVEEVLANDNPALGTASERVALGLEASNVLGAAQFKGLPGVYLAWELASMSFAEVAGLLESGVEQARTGKRAVSKKKSSFSVGLPADKGDCLTPVTAAGRVLASPAFLVLVCVSCDEVAPMRVTLPSVAEFAERCDRQQAWMLESAQVLERAMGADTLLEVSSLPQPFFEGFRAGVENTRDILLMASMSAHTDVRELDAGDIVARVWCGQSRNEVRVAFLRAGTGEILGGVALPVYSWETADVACDCVESVLFEFGVLGIQTAGEALKTNVEGPRDSVQGG
jgi:hypothetical protein